MDTETIYWHLPGLCYFGMINHILFDTMKKFPDKFRDGYKIGSVYGAMPGAIWNGGRNILSGFASKKEAERIIKAYNDQGIPVRFTWTNVLLEEKHVYDTYCNMIMDLANNGFNQVLVNSPILEEYIRKNYPDFKILSSTTKRIVTQDRLMAEMDKDYFLVVLDYDLNHNENIIEKLTPKADKVEILVNETCQPNCPDRVRHYVEISKHQLEFDTSIKFLCSDPNPEKHTFRGTMKCPSFMSNSDIEDYISKGFKNFKIVGRGGSTDFYLDSLVYFLVKVEDRIFIRQYLLETLNKLKNIQPRR